MKCKKCGYSAGFFNLKRGVCKSCREEAGSKLSLQINHLPFKSNEAAFEYASEFLLRPIAKESVVFGMVLGEGSDQGRPTPGKWRVKIATDQGIFEIDRCGSIFGALQSKMGVDIKEIQTGDLVAVELSSYCPKFSIDHDSQIYFIIMKLKPILSIEENVFLPDIPH